MALPVGAPYMPGPHAETIMANIMLDENSGAATGGVRDLLRWEGLALFVGMTLFYFLSGAPWQAYALLFFVPDLSMLGYLAGPRIGATLYNAAHITIGPLLLALVGLALAEPAIGPVSLIWLAHIGLDRALGYGIKYSAGFRLTHLGRIGKDAKRCRPHRTAAQGVLLPRSERLLHDAPPTIRSRRHRRHCCASVMRPATWRGSRASRLSANTVCALPFSAQPTTQPRHRLADLGAEQTGLGADHGVADLGHRQDIAHQVLAALRHRQHAAPQPIDEVDLLDRIDPQVAGQPELVDAAADVAIAVVEQVDIFLHPLGADAACDLLIDRHRRRRDRRAQRMIAIPGCESPLDAVPLEDVLVGIRDDAGFQRDQRVRNLEGRGRQERLPGALPVAGDDQVIVDLVADKGADRAVVGKSSRKTIADLAAPGREWATHARDMAPAAASRPRT